MGSSNPKRRTCRYCGMKLGTGGYTEVRVLDHIPSKVRNGDGFYTKWKSKSRATHYICAGCADKAVATLVEMEVGNVD